MSVNPSPAPQCIPLNTLDRSYLIRESDDSDLYFPMSIMTVVRLKAAQLKDAPSREDVMSALMTLAHAYPRLRLGYALDAEKRRFVRVDADALSAHLNDCVHEVDEQPIEALMSSLIRENNSPISQPVNVFVIGHTLILRVHHSFADGRMLFVLTQSLIATLCDVDDIDLTLSNRWHMPLWRVIWQSPAQGLRVMGQFVRSLFGYYQDFKTDTQDAEAATTPMQREPIKTGSAMCVTFKTISPERMASLKAERSAYGCTLNTLLQVHIEDRLHELDLISRPSTFSVPVDLRRYLNDQSSVCAGNLASQVRVTLTAYDSIESRCLALQAQVQAQLADYAPLTAIPGDWLLALGGDKTYQAVNRDWLMKSTNNDPRFFILTNLGTLDDGFASVADYLSPDEPPHLIVPLMGAPPLVVSFNRFQGAGNLAITYAPDVLSSQDIDTIFDALK